MSSSVLSGPLLHKRGTQQAIASYAGPKGELVVDTTNNTLVVQTGANGGQALAKASTQIIAGTGIAITGGTLASNNTVSLATVSNLTTGTYGPQANVNPSAGGTFTVPSLTVDSYGRVTSAANHTVTIPSNLGGSVVSISNRQTSGTRLATLTIDGTGYDLYYTDTNTDTNTHNTAYLYVGTSSGTGNAVTSNGSTYLILNDGGTYSRKKITGSGIVSVSSDASGNITINGTDTNTHNTAYLYIGTSSGTGNAATSNGSTYLILNDGGTYSRKRIEGSGAIAVSSDSSGHITIGDSGFAPTFYYDTNYNDWFDVIKLNGKTKAGVEWGYFSIIMAYTDSGGTKAGTTIVVKSLQGLLLAAGEDASTKALGDAAAAPNEHITCYSDANFSVYTGLNGSTDGSAYHRAFDLTSITSKKGAAFFGDSDFQVRVNLVVRGNISARAEQDSVGYIATDGYANFGGTLTVGSTSSLKGKVTITTGGLACTGAATFSSTVTSTGNIRPAASDAATCGVNAARWTTVYAKNTTISTSDIRRKTNITDVPDELLDIWDEVKIRIFKWVDSATPRLHAGIIAQDIQAIFEAHGLDIADYSFFCYDSWDDEYEDVEVIDVPGYVDSDGFDIPQVSHIEQRKVLEKGDLYSIRYEEFLVIEAAYQRRRADRLEARIAVLEAKLK